mmetsp:Transcript_3641/g.4132  ORF Transcript_3641/g.4132 Transcript_3641/m.4132 type:complete len:267 (-) Transcript_3641:148-948(-)|eukprot:CAMPEP_0198248862 /NCGR_PEP_ID=MMETSP1447-20131203/528_1 /TAXON_ID=420782 /ORGANISM="Chaetoceros dichaeta, Strain CCMP1751" /LENGTH=266 /DNA_ID=CAMNT_0043933351 /DNA_START=90 /DNA_END=890 /DNA_ORIENTATION=+
MGLNILKKLRKSRATTRSPPEPEPEPQENAESVAVEKLDQDDTITPQTTESTSSEDDDFSPASVANVVDYNEMSMNSKKYNGHESRNGLPVISSDYKSHFRPSDVMGSQQSNTGFKDLRSGTVPRLQESAYAGPPRYDWVDVECAAAIKVQSIFRRNCVITRLEREGKLTASMRNKLRSRQSRKTNKVSEDVPALLRFCGIGFLFNDALGGDSDALNEKEKSRSEDNRQLRLAQDETNRKFRMRSRRGEIVEEAVEVVEEVEEFKE